MCVGHMVLCKALPFRVTEEINNDCSLLKMTKSSEDMNAQQGEATEIPTVFCL